MEKKPSAVLLFPGPPEAAVRNASSIHPNSVFDNSSTARRVSFAHPSPLSSSKDGATRTSATPWDDDENRDRKSLTEAF